MKPLIWLVEDEPSIADTLIYTLESEGFTLRWFDRGEPALAALANGPPALAIVLAGLVPVILLSRAVGSARPGAAGGGHLGD